MLLLKVEIIFVRIFKSPLPGEGIGKNPELECKKSRT
jgi:hypothetical protein